MVGGPSSPQLTRQTPDSRLPELIAFVLGAANQVFGGLLGVSSKATHHIYYSTMRNPTRRRRRRPGI